MERRVHPVGEESGDSESPFVEKADLAVDSRHSVPRMLGDFFRELGVLWFAFSVLEVALKGGFRDGWPFVLGFVVAGAGCLALGMLVERRM